MSTVPKYKYRGVSRKYRKKVNPNIRSYVRSAISRSLETKHAIQSVNQVAFNPQINVGDAIQLCPGIQQGTSQSTRIGNKVRTKKMTMRMVINSIYVAMAGAPTYVDIYFFKNKRSNTISTMADFLQFGAASTDYNGDATPISGLLAVNDDVYRSCIHERVEVFNPANTTTVAYAASINPSVCLTFDLTRFIKKTLEFDDAGNICSNDNLFLAIGTSQTDGANIGGVNAVECTYVLEYEFTDA